MRALVLKCLAAFAALTVPAAAQQPAAPGSAKFVDYYQNAYAQGRDLIPGPQRPLDPTSMLSALKFETVMPEAALTGNAFADADNNVIKLAGVQGCQSSQQLRFGDKTASCTMISLAGLNAALQTAATPAGGAFPCHFLAGNTGSPPVRFAECFFIGDDDRAQPLSEYLIRKGLAFASRLPNGDALFPEYASAETEAAKARAGIWANTIFAHPYGDRYRINQTN